MLPRRRPLRRSRLCLLALAAAASSCSGGPEEAQAPEVRPAEAQAPEVRPAEPQVTEAQAIDAARRQAPFEPEAAEAELVAGGDPPVWRVALRGRLPGGSVFQFEEAVVTIDARTGDVVGVERP